MYPHDERIKIGDAGSISISTHETLRVITSDPHPANSPQNPLHPDLVNLFKNVATAPATIPERFPCLTFLAIAISLLLTALTAELDYLHGAGYLWP